METHIFVLGKLTISTGPCPITMLVYQMVFNSYVVDHSLHRHLQNSLFYREIPLPSNRYPFCSVLVAGHPHQKPASQEFHLPLGHRRGQRQSALAEGALEVSQGLVMGGTDGLEVPVTSCNHFFQAF